MVDELEIEAVVGREILDFRGNLTVGVEACLTGGVTGRAAIPSGASTGKFEAVEFRDGGKRYNGLGVKSAAEHVNTALSEAVLFESVLEQRHIDRLLLETDGMESEGKLGTNAILGVFMAVARVAINGLRMPPHRYLEGIYISALLIPMMNILNGGKHADNTVDLQELMIMPYGTCCSAGHLRMCAEVYHTLEKPPKEEGYSTGVGDEGGFAPDLKDSEAVLEFLVRAMEKSGLKLGTDMKIAIDVAPNEFYDEASGMYLLPGESRMTGEEIRRSAREMVNCYRRLMDAFPICSIEDGLQEEDQEGWKMFTGELGGRIQLVGDDLFATNTKRLLRDIELGAGNAILVKISQIGTLTESFEATEMAKRAGFGTIISYHPGETEDPIIVDITVAVNAGQIETGVLCRSDRVARYDQLLCIKENLEGQSALKKALPLSVRPAGACNGRGWERGWGQVLLCPESPLPAPFNS